MNVLKNWKIRSKSVLKEIDNTKNAIRMSYALQCSLLNLYLRKSVVTMRFD